ncbi:YihA family ribosome biogenesis GTP-binding protein [Clostridium thermosuccinogenes]|jgi:GTP-binding protein|uniref:Probable GTP-binding protein EngB n=1 Tax=Clostridium thermosuccinogenes TaxID=84032 RepID=A0A2K2F3M9_9CLOT|nr:ribosome biogenesis GTP-binding protein YihA/YsxC [Pseudoclostridium thermosuccinogenes]AUS95904.1 YihA family ribosome biogenesis GTP-binding protein [Pseudoclostridium thermosuccinogenes]PNT93382.1 YihA family ribosome biogenesis GTP-binding protein [Pseudoclostridium thermosuccinogenes]PNT97909.1 YihA family ribosome biogenesis GTP-binding protein [Pseudoclostridium thermosuccinogenes]PNT99841.1 YihA family ribosome biogenesis GTP-binding protein [Pseudoclostridium thermosuccinogenes]
MVVKNAKLEATAVKPEQYPEKNLQEVVFVGRSNVGKSSIINSLANRKSLARVGSTPGKTRVINFYNIDDKLYLVDLPGYGYAGVSKTMKASWGNIVETYLNTRENIQLIIMLVDIRHKPTQDDKIMYEWLAANMVRHVVVASKADKISRSAIKPRLKEIKDALGVPDEVKIIPYSSENGAGRDELWTMIEESISGI